MGDQGLDIALQDRNWTLAARLIEERRGLRHTDTGWNVLHTAIWKNAPVYVVKLLLESVDPNKCDDSGENSIHFAMRFSVHPDLLRILLEAGGSVNAPNLYGQSPMVVGVMCNSPVELLLKLAQQGGYSDIRDGDGRNSLGWSRFLNQVAHNVLTRVSTLVIMRSARAVPRLGRNSLLIALPPELLRRLITFL